jgi:hypothetical protein
MAAPGIFTAGDPTACGTVTLRVRAGREQSAKVVPVRSAAAGSSCSSALPAQVPSPPSRWAAGGRRP